MKNKKKEIISSPGFGPDLTKWSHGDRNLSPERLKQIEDLRKAHDVLGKRWVTAETRPISFPKQ